MTRRLNGVVFGWLLVVLMASVAPSWAQTESFAKQGTYIGFLASPGTTFKGGAFDGNHYFATADELMALPGLTSADGLGFVVGGRFEAGAVEMSYIRADHPAVFVDVSLRARSHVLNIDGKRFFLHQTRVQPYFTGGMTIPWLVVEGGAISRTSEGNATFVGVGFNLGGGLAVYVHPRVALSAGYNYRLAVFPRVKGANGSFLDIEDKSEPVGRHGNLTASVSVTF
jgi:hypothetical protein